MGHDELIRSIKPKEIDKLKEKHLDTELDNKKGNVIGYYYH